MPVENRAFGSFFVLLGAGVVGTIFGLVSFRIMEEQESLMNERMQFLASKFNEILAKRKAKKILLQSQSQSQSHSPSQSSLSSSVGRLENDNSTYSISIDQTPSEAGGEKNYLNTIKKTIKNNISKLFRFKWNTDNEFKAMSDVHVAVYENEITDMKISAIGNILLFFITLFVGALSMSVLEGWNFTDAVYWVSNCYAVCVHSHYVSLTLYLSLCHIHYLYFPYSI